MPNSQAINVGVFAMNLDPKGNNTSHAFLSSELDVCLVPETIASSSPKTHPYGVLDELSPVGIFHTDAHGHCTNVNQRWCELAGLNYEEALGTGWGKQMHEDDKHWVYQAWIESVQSHEPFSAEFRFVREDRVSNWVYAEALPQFNDHNQLIGYVGSVTDIGDRKQTELALEGAKLETYAELCHKTADLEAIICSIPDALIFADRDRRIRRVNRAFTKLFGYTLQQVVGEKTQILYESTAVAQEQGHIRFNPHSKAISKPYEVNYRCQDGVLFPGETISAAVRNNDGEVTGYIKVIRNIAAQKAAEQALNESEVRYRHLYEQTPVMLHSIDAKGRLISVSDYWLKKLGYERDEVLGRPSTDFLTEASRQYAQDVLKDYFQTGTCTEIPYQMVCKNGQIIDVLLSAIADRDESGTIIRSLAVIVDVTKQKQLEHQLSQALSIEKELAHITLNSIGDAVISTNASGEVFYFNPVAEQLTGWTAEEAKGKPIGTIFQLVNELTLEPVENPIDRVLWHKEPTGIPLDTALVGRNGKQYGIEDSAAPIIDEDGVMQGAVLVFRDVTHTRKLASQLSWQANHDELTQLVNRRYFEQKVTQALESVFQEKQSHVLCYLDLDQFKVVNDTCGHAAGDQLLCQVSLVLKQVMRASDTLARLGGDEFGILLYQCPLERAKYIAEKLRQAIQDYRFIWNDKSFGIGVSIGLVEINENSETLASVLSAADAACYGAKEAGRNRVCVYQASNNQLTTQRQERQWSIRIRQALEDQQFRLFYQPIVPTETMMEAEEIHYEILIRMVDEDGKMVPPNAFIPAAERYNLMPDVDRWVIQTCFSKIASGNCLPFHEDKSITYAINLSGVSLNDGTFFDFIQTQFAATDIDPGMICFEITETAAIADLNNASSFIQSLKALGCQFALDDFGSGMSSFAYLNNLPVDFIKIDGRFVRELDSPTTYAIVEAINHVGHVMGLRTIAEMVENSKIAQRLKKIGIDYTQGYEIARPMLWA